MRHSTVSIMTLYSLLDRLQSILCLEDRVILVGRGRFSTGRWQQVLFDVCLSVITFILFGVQQTHSIGLIRLSVCMVEVFNSIGLYGLDCHFCKWYVVHQCCCYGGQAVSPTRQMYHTLWPADDNLVAVRTVIDGLLDVGDAVTAVIFNERCS